MTASAASTIAGGVLFTRDPRAVPWWWLHYYFPATAGVEASRETPIDLPVSAVRRDRQAERAAGTCHLRADIDDGEWHRRWGGLLALEAILAAFLVS